MIGNRPAKISWPPTRRCVLHGARMCSHGSLVAPFGGEHGWYWLSLEEKTITITLTVTGYFNDIKDYGIIGYGAAE